MCERESGARRKSGWKEERKEERGKKKPVRKTAESAQFPKRKVSNKQTNKKKEGRRRQQQFVCVCVFACLCVVRVTLDHDTDLKVTHPPSFDLKHRQVRWKGSPWFIFITPFQEQGISSRHDHTSQPHPQPHPDHVARPLILISLVYSPAQHSPSASPCPPPSTASGRSSRASLRPTRPSTTPLTMSSTTLFARRTTWAWTLAARLPASPLSSQRCVCMWVWVCVPLGCVCVPCVRLRGLAKTTKSGD